METLIFEKNRLRQKLNVLPWNEDSKTWPLCSLTDDSDAYTADKVPFPCQNPDPLVSKKKKRVNSNSDKPPVAKRVKRKHAHVKTNARVEQAQTKIVFNNLTPTIPTTNKQENDDTKTKQVSFAERIDEPRNKNDESSAKLKPKTDQRVSEKTNNEKSSQQTETQTAVAVIDKTKKPTHEEFLTNFINEDHYLKLQCLFTSFGGYDISEEDLWDLVFQYYTKRKSSTATFMQVVLRNASQMANKKFDNDVFFLREEYSDTKNFAKIVKKNDKDLATMKTFIRLFAALMPTSKA